MPGIVVLILASTKVKFLHHFEHCLVPRCKLISIHRAFMEKKIGLSFCPNKQPTRHKELTSIFLNR